MNDQVSGVVGVDGSTSALHAVRWAAREAARRQAPLRLLHVCHLAPVRHPRQVAPPSDYHAAVLDQGRHWLTEASRVANAAAPVVALTTDPDAANELWAKIDKEITDQAPWAAMFNPKLVDFVSKRVKGYQFSPQWYFLIPQASVQ